ncbi:FKBP-type peptidyl-prolyl cis-trans isomerase [uncultured Paraglaciecola sp.]|uniref:protein kinase domain-containing protein n=1 Tax=uncultured Paraglaciecola sp. TaxID=1765024 RepID=UPI002632B433|nr:FKBP-type peptidyl-prolyl cis-trans isomerase [uncultured Paraglaciecola sp.]
MQQIGKYRIIKELGAGGFGAVYLAEDPRLHTQVAIKVFQVRDANIAGQATSATSDAVGVLTERFINEARTLRTLSSNPFIVDMYEFDELEDGTPYYIMPYLTRSLVDVMGKDAFTVGAIEETSPELHPKAIAPAQSILYLKQLLEALSEVHKSGLVHRDIKPANILLNNKGQVQLCDFGIAKLPDAEHSQSGLGMGSRNYMSPEQRDSAKHVTPSSDIYSVGILAYRMLTGQLPLGRFQDPIHFAPNIGEAINALILQAIELQPDQRPVDASKMLKMLKQAEQQMQGGSNSQEDEVTGTWIDEGNNTSSIKAELKPLKDKVTEIILREGEVPKQEYFQLEALAAIASLDKTQLDDFIKQTSDQLAPQLKPLQNWLALVRQKAQADELNEKTVEILTNTASNIGLNTQQATTKIEVIYKAYAPKKVDDKSAVNNQDQVNVRMPNGSSSRVKGLIFVMVSLLVLGGGGYLAYESYQDQQFSEKNQEVLKENDKKKTQQVNQKQLNDESSAERKSLQNAQDQAVQQEQKDWQLAQSINTSQSYQDYMTKYPIGKYQEQAKKSQQALTSPSNAKERSLFLQANAKKPGVIVTKSGLQYEQLVLGSGEKPTVEQSVSVHYKGSFINGTEFDSSYQRGAPSDFPVNKVILGFTEALLLMPVGSKFRVTIPPELAYGKKGVGKIGPNTILIFEIELLGIK